VFLLLARELLPPEPGPEAQEVHPDEPLVMRFWRLLLPLSPTAVPDMSAGALLCIAPPARPAGQD
jgi:hypothetical protein